MTMFNSGERDAMYQRAYLQALRRFFRGEIPPGPAAIARDAAALNRLQADWMDALPAYSMRVLRQYDVPAPGGRLVPEHTWPAILTPSDRVWLRQHGFSPD